MAATQPHSPATTILLVRHGHAGVKGGWPGDDLMRPLSSRGWAEAGEIALWATPLAPTVLISSPAKRCRQTVVPLSTKLEVPVETCDELGPTCSSDAIDVLTSLTPRADPVVLCTHGEVIQYLQRHLRGATAAGFGDDQPRDKGSIWILQVVDREVTSAHYVSPIAAR
jgi:8-oxo-dGTP diphosphatase